MSSGNTQTTIDALLKYYYDDGALVNETYMDNPLWAMMTKRQAVANVTGRSFIHPVVYATSQGRRVNFAQAQAAGQITGELSVDFTVPRFNNYQDASVATETVLSTRDDRGAFTRAVTLVTDDCLRNLGLDQAIAMYGDGSGVRGNISASTTIASSQLVLAIADNALYFEVGMALDLATSPTAAVKAYGTAGHGLYVIAVDRINGILTIGTTPNPATATPCNISDATNGIPSAADGDFIFVQGDQGLKMTGIQAWIPNNSSTLGTSFLGVNRSIDPVRLAGNWLDGTQLSVEDALIQGATNVKKQSSMGISHAFMGYSKFAQLLKSQSAKVVIEEQVNPDVSFEGVELLTSSGRVAVIPDRNCPPNRIFGLNLGSWDFIHLGDPVQVFNYDGNTWLRQPSDDGMEIRFFSLGNLVCRVPAANINIAVNP
jgi:hypothetical protein